MVVALAACGADDAPGSTGGGPTIVSLNPCLDAILVEVAAPAQILALSQYSRDPSASSMDVARARDFGVTGGTVEEVIALDPDIVLASTFIAPTTRNALEQLGVRVETFGSPVSVEESVEQVRDLAILRVGGFQSEARCEITVPQTHQGGDQIVAQVGAFFLLCVRQRQLPTEICCNPAD